MPKRIAQSIKDDCVRLRTVERVSVCDLSRRFGLSTATIYPWIKHIPLARREFKAPSTAWNPREDAALRQMWPFTSWAEILSAIPRHTKSAIGKRANDLGVRRHHEANSRRKDIDPLFVALRRAREGMGLTRNQFAKKIGYHPAQIARWELGDDVPPWRAIKLFAEVVGRKIILADVTAGGERSVVFQQRRAA